MNTQHQLNIVQTRINEAEKRLSKNTSFRQSTDTVRVELENLLRSLKAVRHELLLRNDSFDLQ